MGKSITFLRGQGGVPKTLPGEDHISAFVMYLPESHAMPTAVGGGGFTVEEPVKAISTIEKAEEYGITADAASWHIRVLHYHLGEVFRINPAISLYVGLFNDAATGFDFSELKMVQNFAAGRIRQIAVYAPTRNLVAADITLLQGVANSLQMQSQPVQVLYASKVSEVTALPQLRAIGQNRVSVDIGQDGEGLGSALFADAGNTPKQSVTTIGNLLGMVSLASVHESIGWVQKFPSGITTPAFADGTLVRTVDRAVVEQLDTDGYLFLVTHPGIGGSYRNDSHTLDEATSDYAFIEANRTMDKAERGIRTYLTPHLSRPLYVNAETGELASDMVVFLEMEAGRQLDAMEAAGELSGYKVEVDSAQNVLASSMVEFVIKQVQVGVMRRMKVKIGYTTKIS